MAVWKVFPSALAALASEIGTDFGWQILGQDVYGLGVVFGKKEHAHVHDRALLGWVSSTIAAGLLLALGGSHFCILVWGGRIMLHIAAMILVDVIWRGRKRNMNWSRGTHVWIGERAPSGEFGYGGSKDGNGAVCGLRKGYLVFKCLHDSQRLYQQLGIELRKWAGSGHDVDVAKICCKLGKEVKDVLKKGVYVPMKGWHTSLGGSVPSVKVRIVW